MKPEIWIPSAIGALTIVVTIVLWLVERGRKRLEYVVITNTPILPGRVANDLEVSHHGTAFPDPALSITRIVNTGNKEIRPDDYETELIVTFEGVHGLGSATWSASRPAGLGPKLAIDGNKVLVEKRLINVGEMLELQVLSSGQPSDVSVGGRIAALTFEPRKALPYPPGSGSEGQMVAFDRFMWFLLLPAAILGGGIAISSARAVSATGEALILVATGLVLGAYLLFTKYLVNRRRRWRP
jgi:hypothetical protein